MWLRWTPHFAFMGVEYDILSPRNSSHPIATTNHHGGKLKIHGGKLNHAQWDILLRESRYEAIGPGTSNSSVSRGGQEKRYAGCVKPPARMEHFHM